MSRTRAALVLGALAAVATSTNRAAAQDSASSGEICLNHPQPGPICAAIALTDVGVYYQTGGNGEYHAHARIIADWGLLMAAGRRSAAGGSIFISLEPGNFTIGPALRYRRWSGDAKSSVEFAIGVPLTSRETIAHGLIKWNASRLVGFSIRPELRRTLDYSGCVNSPFACSGVEHRRVAVAFGVEIGGVPGIALAAAGALFAGAALAAAGGSNGDWR
jgi:hypothetical protein